MVSSRFTRLLWLYLTILLTFSQELVAKPTKSSEALPKVPLDPDGLQVQLDHGLYESPKRSVLFSSHLRFKKKPSISDGQVKGLAVQAYKEMESLLSKYKFGNRRTPNVMTALVVDNEIIFASSQKGETVIGKDSEVSKDLDLCKGESTNDHKNQRRCGEVMAFDEYYKSRVNPKKLDKTARIVSIARQRDAEGVYQYAIIAPCGTVEDNGGKDDKWGCNRLVKDITVLDDDTVAKDPESESFNYKKWEDDGDLEIKQLPAQPDEGNEQKNPGSSSQTDGSHKQKPGSQDGSKDGRTNKSEKSGEEKVEKEGNKKPSDTITKGAMFGVDAAASWKAFENLLGVQGVAPADTTPDPELSTAINDLLKEYESIPAPPTVAAGEAAVAAEEEALWASLKSYEAVTSTRMSEAEIQQGLNEIMEEYYPSVEANVAASTIGDADLVAFLDTLPVITQEELLAANVDVGVGIEAGAEALGDEDIIAMLPEVPEGEIEIEAIAEAAEGSSFIEAFAEAILVLA
ncbi:hypothetical protein QQS21_002939 [Conoideocrella luteorostrata]|uniref:Uncharacterized protein n=1 Tax=Conoideocrella luteorostrata TaxID=1105319 RepID=A0AAJ0FW04_9HYPO|nr:hypothetical protein QQS21_002939 [Conoideocrella luteorostrata]